MKKYLFFSLCLFLIQSEMIKAQMVGTDVFLKGSFVEVGVSNYGYYGSQNAPPTGYHPRPANRLGFVADPAMDGWSVGTPDYMGDYFVPGSPQEGFDIMANGVWNKAWGMNYGFTTGTGPLLLTGSNTGYAVIGNKKYGYWNGTMGDLVISQTTVLDTNRVYFLVDVKLKNTGTTTITDVYYERTVDADNEQTLPGGGFPTNNLIVFQPDGLPGGDDKCLVSSTGNLYPALSFLGLAAVDCRAKCYIIPNDGTLAPMYEIDDIYNGSTAYLTALGNNNAYDAGIGVIFKIGNLAPGDSATFSYAYILRAADIDSAFSTLAAKWNLTGTSGEIIDGDTLELCRGGSFPISISGGDAYEWGNWYPNTGLAYPSGRENIITVPNTTTTWYVVGTNPVCLQTDTLFITIKPLGDTTLINKTICGGSTYDFNGDLLFNTGTYTKIYPTALDGCDSVIILNLTVNPLPNVELDVPLTTICEGDVSLMKLTNPTTTATYKWYRDNSFVSNDVNYQYIATTSGTYYTVATSAQNCVDTSRKVKITVNPAAVANILTEAPGVICIGDSIKIAAQEFPNYEYRWAPERYFRYTSGYRSPVVTGIMSDKENIVTLTTMNEYGCMAQDQLIVQAKPCCEVLMPTVFTPNGDGNNDYFNIILKPGQKVLSFQVFDRLGNLVYDNQNTALGWNGNIENGSVPAAQAVYMYRVLYSCTDGYNYEHKGDVTLVK